MTELVPWTRFTVKFSGTAVKTATFDAYYFKYNTMNDKYEFLDENDEVLASLPKESVLYVTRPRVANQGMRDPIR